MTEQNENKINGFDDRNLENDLKKFARRWFSEEFIAAKEEYVNSFLDQDFELFLKRKKPALLAEWLNFKNKKQAAQSKNYAELDQLNDYDIPDFLKKPK